MTITVTRLMKYCFLGLNCLGKKPAMQAEYAAKVMRRASGTLKNRGPYKDFIKIQAYKDFIKIHLYSPCYLAFEFMPV